MHVTRVTSPIAPASILRPASATLAFVAVVGLGVGNAHAGVQDAAVHKVDPGRYPDAVCNNGEIATYNYLPSDATGPVGDVDYRKKWLVVLSGGGGCVDMAHCSARWIEGTREGPNLDGGPGNHWNMVPRPDNRNFDGKGILDFDGEADAGVTVSRAVNPFAGVTDKQAFNRVWVHYCSSDTWAGLGTPVAIGAASFPESFGAPGLTQLRFGGAKIVDAVIATIMRGDVGGDGASVDRIPDGADGELVLAGSSAGGVGTIRNLDTVAHDIASGVPSAGPIDNGFAAAPGVKVYGIIDAATAVIPARDSAGDAGYDAAAFYTDGHPEAVRNDDDCDGDGTVRCYAVGVHVVRDEITTPYFVVQQAFDHQIHSGLKQGLLDQLATSQADLQTGYPLLFGFLAAMPGDAAAAVEAFIRFLITTNADSIGVARNNPAGLFIPNYASGWHQLMADSKRFFTSEAQQWHGPDDPGSPRLGPSYANTTVSIPTTLALFRQCVLGDRADYNGCVSTIRQQDVDLNVRVINSTAIPTP